MGPGFESLRVYKDKVLKTIEFQNLFLSLLNITIITRLKNIENLPYVDATTGGIYLFFII